MKKRQKQILFFSLALFFILTSIFFVFYTQGYRFDFKNKKIVQTGGLFLKVYPSGAKIYINGKYIKTTNFLFDSLFLPHLLPGNYSIKIEKDGYHLWSKNLPVKERWVSEAKYITLFPKNLNFEYLFGGVEKLFFLPSKDGFIIKNQDNSLSFLDSSLKITSILENKNIGNIEDVVFLPDKNKILIIAKKDQEKKYFLLNLGQRQISEINFQNYQIQKIKFSLDNQIFFLQNATLFIFDPNLNEFSKINFSFSTPILDFDFINGDIILLTKEGFLYRGKINKGQFQIMEVLNTKPLNIDENANYTLKVLQNNIFLFENEKLYWLDNFLHRFFFVIDVAKKIEPSPDNKKIAISTGNQIWLFWLQNDYQQPQRTRLEKFLLNVSEGKIKNMLWLNPYYLIFSSSEGIKITEIDNRSNINEITISEFKNPEIFWDPTKKRLFAFVEGKLYYTENLIK